MNALRSETYHFAELAARELEDLITVDFMDEEIFVDIDATDEGQGFILIRTTPSKAGELSARFADSVSITDGDKTHEVSLFIRPLTPKARMI